jgi:hypothetical protein
LEDGAQCKRFKEYANVDGQAYDRGYQVGMQLRRARQDELKRYDWANDPNAGD